VRQSTVGMLAVGVVLAGAVIWQAVGQTGPRRQTTCPITGHAIDPGTSPHVDWEGQRIYFASEATAQEFRHDPDAVFETFEKQNVRLENVETTCPVSGEALTGIAANGPVISYKGRTIRFCCPDCPGKFEVDPSRYLAGMPGEQVASR